MVKNTKSTYQTIKIFDMDVFSSSKNELLNLLTTHLKTQKTLLSVVTPNPEQIVLSRNNHAFLDHLQSADIRIPDGIGLVIASKLLDLSGKSESLKERIGGREVAEYLLSYANNHDIKVLIIGGKAYAEASTDTVRALKLQLDGQSLNNIFWTKGYEEVQHPTETEESDVRDALKKVKPEIVLVAFGAPWQEEWMMTHKSELAAAGVTLALVVGGAVDVLVGKIPRAPRLFQNLGLEWLFRLLQEPWRWRRQLKLLEFIKLTYQSL